MAEVKILSGTFKELKNLFHLLEKKIEPEEQKGSWFGTAVKVGAVMLLVGGVGYGCYIYGSQSTYEAAYKAGKLDGAEQAAKAATEKVKSFVESMINMTPKTVTENLEVLRQQGTHALEIANNSTLGGVLSSFGNTARQWIHLPERLFEHFRSSSATEGIRNVGKHYNPPVFDIPDLTFAKEFVMNKTAGLAQSASNFATSAAKKSLRATADQLTALAYNAIKSAPLPLQITGGAVVTGYGVNQLSGIFNGLFMIGGAAVKVSKVGGRRTLKIVKFLQHLAGPFWPGRNGLAHRA